MIKMSQCHILEQTQDNAVADIPLDLDNNRRASLSDIFFSNSGQESPVLGKTDLELGEVSVNHVISKMAIKTLPDSSPMMETSDMPVMLTQVALSVNASQQEFSLSNILDVLKTSEQNTCNDFEDDAPSFMSSTLQKNNSEDSEDEFCFDIPEKVKAVNILSEMTRRDSGDWNQVKVPVHFETKPEGSLFLKTENGAKTFSLPEIMHKTVVPSEPEEKLTEFFKPAVEANQQTCFFKTDVKKDATHEHIITSSASDWDNVETVEAGFSDMQSGKGEPAGHTVPLLSFSEAWTHFCKADNSEARSRIRQKVERRGISAIIHSLFGPPKLQRNLHRERELVFCAAATSLDNQNTHHVHCLQTTYCILTGSCFSCKRFGSHWEEIGFQGHDPATDLRGTGMLGLLQLLYLLQDSTTAQLARGLYQLSHHPIQIHALNIAVFGKKSNPHFLYQMFGVMNFPFCVMCINISRICLQALREDILNRECNKQQAVMTVVNQLYAGALLYLYHIWKKGKTIRDSGFVIKEIETRTRKHAKEVLRDLKNYTTSSKAVDNLEEINFFSVVNSNT